MGAIAAIAAGLLGAGGAVGGSLLSKPSATGTGENPIGTAGVDPRADPILAALSFNNLINLGVSDPSIFQFGSPLNRAIQASNATPQSLKQRSGKLINVMALLGRADSDEFEFEFGPGGGLRSIFNKEKDRRIVLDNDEIDFLIEFAGRIGLTVRELVQQEQLFKGQVESAFPRAREIADLQQRNRLELNQRLADLSQDVEPLSLGQLIESERGRLDRELGQTVEQRREDLIGAARAGGFNPGAGLEELTRFEAEAREDADLVALSRAIATLGNQQAAVSNQANLLQSLLTPESSLQLASLRQPPQAGSAQFTENQADPLGMGIAAAGTSLANSVDAFATRKFLADQAALDRRSRGLTAPASGGTFKETSGKDLAAFNALSGGFR